MDDQQAIHLSILLFWPMALALGAALGPKRIAPLMQLAGTLVPLGYVVVMLFDFDTSTAAQQYVTNDAWIEELGVRYHLAIDGLSLWMIVLTALLFAFSALWVVLRPVERPRLFAFHMGVAETAVLGAFMAQDLALFVLFFDLMLVPFAFLVLGWGGPERRAATIKFFVYTLVGSLLMLAAAVALAVLSRKQLGEAELSFALSDLTGVGLPESTQRWLFIAFALAFLIKMPMFPFQGWMPDAYRQMPLPALAVFSAVLSKVAAYGFLRIVLPILPDATEHFQTLVMILALLSILYGSAMAFTQTELRLILGYSSVAQLGFITLGIFALRDEGFQGALLQMVQHGLVVAPLFFILLLVSERAGGSEDIRDLGGVAFRGPVLATFFLIVALATLAIPGSANFVGEFLILLGVFKETLVIAAIAFTGVVLASVYMLRAYIRAMHNRKGPAVESRDLSFKDGLVLAPIVAAILAFGLYPQLALEHSEQAVAPPEAPVAQAPAAQPPAAVPPGTAPGQPQVIPEGGAEPVEPEAAP